MSNKGQALRHGEIYKVSANNDLNMLILPLIKNKYAAFARAAYLSGLTHGSNDRIKH